MHVSAYHIVKAEIQKEPILLWKLIEPMDRVSEVKTEVALPRFKFEQTMDLKTQLQELGIRNLFSQADADLSGRYMFVNIMRIEDVIFKSRSFEIKIKPQFIESN